jgi:AcrR family transcriptional regulator
MSKKYTREQWLQKSLDAISGQRFGRVVIDNIVTSLGVTKGSFYWHFKDRNDFLEKLVTYWDERFTKTVMHHINESEAGPHERLLELMLYITRNRLASYDAAITALAHNEPQTSNHIGEIFESRMHYVATLFAEMGYKGTDLEMRSRMLVMFMSQEQNIPIKKPLKEQIKLMKKAHALLTC